MVSSIFTLEYYYHFISPMRVTYFTHLFSLDSVPWCGCNPELNFCILDPNMFLSPNIRSLCSYLNVRDRDLHSHNGSIITVVVDINFAILDNWWNYHDFNGKYLWYLIHPSGNFRHERNFDLLQFFQNILNFPYF
jgi:hypothetical protein